MVHGPSDIQEVPEELGRGFLISPVMFRQFERHSQHIDRIHSHPAGGISLLEFLDPRRHMVAVKYPDIIQTKETTFKNIRSIGILLVHPPGEIHQQFLKSPFQEIPVGFTRFLFIRFKHIPYAPGMNGWIHITEIPLISRDLSIGMHVVFPQHHE